MGSKWATVSIDDIKLPEKYSCVGGPFGSSLSQKHYVDSGVPVIRGTNLAGDIFSESDFVFVSPDKANELQRNMAFRGDIVFTQRGTLGQVALIPEDSLYEKYIVSQSQMKLTVNPKQADAYFIYTYFRTNEAKALIENNAIVGGVPHINLGILKEFKLRLPPLSEQKRISEVSKSIDNKINLNRQINQTLEQMSQTLFKSWFVDFDPVIDNALDAGNPIPGVLQSRAELRQKVRNSADFKPLPADIRALFPAEFEETELGWVPKGWILSDLGKEFNITMGQSPSGSTYNEDGIGLPFFQGKTDFGFRFPSKRIYCTEPKRLAKRFDTLLSVRAPVGVVNQASTECIIGRGLAALRHKSGNIAFTYYSVSNLSDYFSIFNGEGTVFGSINQKDLKQLPQICPPEKLINKFEEFSGKWETMISVHCNEIESLSNLRDTLLPKLISGELSLEDLPDLVTQTEPA